MKRTENRTLFAENEKFAGNEVTVCGWVRSVRSGKHISFITINDGSCFNNVQIVAEESLPEFGEISKLNVGAAVCVRGVLELTPEAKQPFEITAENVEVEGASSPDYPLQKKAHSLEFLRGMTHLRMRTNTLSAVFRVRSVLAQAIHEFFGSEGFVYAHTPIITSSDCEGAGEMFRVTTMTPAEWTPDENGNVDFSKDFFGKPASLTVSGQLEGEVAAMAFGKIYTFGPSFRAEKSNTLRHVAEFWHIEPEIAFCELPDLIEFAEEMIKYIIRDFMEKCPAELKFFEERFEKGLTEKLLNVVNNDFAVVDYTDAIEMLKKADVKFEYPVEWGCDLQSEHERYITEKIYNKPVFLINYPKDIKSFYMKQNPDGKTVAATDLLVPGVGEIIGGSEREADLTKLLNAMKEKGMSTDDYKDYLDLRKYGTVPHAGFGLGFERIIMYCTGMQNIRDVIFYPRTVGNIR